MTDTNYHAFISYSRKNTVIKDRIVSNLESYGFKVWVDSNKLPPGTIDWENEIRKVIPRSICVIYLASIDARNSQIVRDELNLGERHGKTILPVWVEGEHWIDCIPLGRSYTQRAADLRNENYDKEIEIFLHKLLGVIEKSIDSMLREQTLIYWKGTLLKVLQAINEIGSQYKPLTGEPFTDEFLSSYREAGLGFADDDREKVRVLLQQLMSWHLISVEKIAEIKTHLRERSLTLVRLTDIGKKIIMERNS